MHPLDPTPVSYYYGNESARRPRLVFKDHTTYAVEDYWRVDDQLHFVTSEEGGTKSVPRTAPFANLDVERTTAAAEAQGFRFALRDEPIEQWLQHHRQSEKEEGRRTK